MPGFVDQAQLHAVRATAGPARCRGGARRTSTGAGPTAATAATAATSGWSRRERVVAPRFQDHPARRATTAATARARAPRRTRRTSTCRCPSARLCAPRRGGGGGPGHRGDRFLGAEGGQGGRGNARFLSNRRRAPAFAEQAEPGQEFWLDLELKLMADVALVGFPNAGKSTLISTVSAAKPKIADYPFTTLEPHLGVVRVGGAHDGTDFVMADIPGLVEGAAEGKGLGHQFLRHIERARVLVVLLDLGAPLAGGEPAADQLRVLLAELGAYRPELLERPRVVAGSKADLVAAGGDAAGEAVCDLVLSAATGAGVDQLVGRLAALVNQARAEAAAGLAAGSGEVVVHRPLPEGVDVQRSGAGAWLVVGRAAERAVALSDLTDAGAQAEAIRRLRRLGVDRALARAGARDGDEVTVGTMTFTWGEGE